MPLSKEDCSKLDGVKNLMLGTTIVKDILPWLTDVLTRQDIERIQNTIIREDSAYGLMELIHRYKQRATDLKPLIDALNHIRHRDIATKLETDIPGISGTSTAIGNESQSHSVVPTKVPRVDSAELPHTNAVSFVKNAFEDQFQTINPLPFEPDIELKLDEIWINLELENKKDKESVADAASETDCLVKVASAFSNAKVVICKGDPGCGKSTLCNYLCYKWAIGEWGNDFKLVLFARLRDVEKTESMIQLAINWMVKFGFFDDKDNLLKVARECKTLVILDGYDERQGICGQMENLLESTNYHIWFNLLLTSCSWAVDNERIKYRGKAQILKILPLIKYQQEEYAGKIIQDDRKVKSLFTAMKNKYDGSLKKLSQNILPFSYICFYCQTQKGDDFELPFKTVDQLYYHLFARLVDRYEEKQKKKAEWNWEILPEIRQLGKMAIAGMGKAKRNPQLSFTIYDLLQFKIDESYCTGAGLLIKNCYKHTGSSSVVYYSFAHRTAQHYLARKCVIDIYKEIDPTQMLDDNAFGRFYAAGNHLDFQGVADRLKRFTESRGIEKDLIRMAQEDSKNVVPVAIIFIEKSMELISTTFAPLSTLCDLLDSQSGQSDSQISRVRDAFKGIIRKKISEIVQEEIITDSQAKKVIVPLDLCHKVDLGIYRVFENGNTVQQSISVLYLHNHSSLLSPTKSKSVCYLQSSVLERFKQPIPRISVTELPQVIDYLRMHKNVTVEDLARSPRLPISNIGCIRTRTSCPSHLLEFSITPSLSQPHPSAEDNGETKTITVSMICTERENLAPYLKYYQSLHPPPLISSIGMDVYGLREGYFNLYDWESVSSLLLNFHKIKLYKMRFFGCDFPMSRFIEFMSLFKNLRHVDLTEWDPWSSEEYFQLFLEWVEPLILDRNVSVEYTHDSDLGRKIDQYRSISSLSNGSVSGTD